MLFTEFNQKFNFFRKKYIRNFINRFSNASLSIEEISDDLSNTQQALNIFYQTEALEQALSLEENVKQNPMSQCNELKELVSLISGGELTDFRKTCAVIMGTDTKLAQPNTIRQKLYTMFDDYNNFIEYEIDGIDPVFLKEAQLHIRLLHIHPFEDGNGRVSRIILARNLLFQNRVPCVITKEVKEEYCSYIRVKDEIGLAKFLQRLATKELQTILCMYNDLNDKGLIKENLMTPQQVIKYNEIMGIKNNETKTIIYPLRNIKDIISFFKHGYVEYMNKVIVQANYGHKFIFDNENGDYGMYCEANKTLIIKKYGDERLFMVKQIGTELCFMVDDEKKFYNEFEYELQKQEEKTDINRQYKIF